MALSEVARAAERLIGESSLTPGGRSPNVMVTAPGRGAVWLARLHGVQKVAGSSPVAPIVFRKRALRGKPEGFFFARSALLSVNVTTPAAPPLLPVNGFRRQWRDFQRFKRRNEPGRAYRNAPGTERCGVVTRGDRLRPAV